MTGQKCLSDLILEPVLAKFPDSVRFEPDPVHRLNVCVNFIEIGTYQPVILFPVTDDIKFRNEWYAIYYRIVPRLIVIFFSLCLTTVIQNGAFQVTWEKDTENLNIRKSARCALICGSR